MQSTEDSNSNKKYEQKMFGRWFTITLALRLYSIKRRLTTTLVILMGVVGLLLRFSATNPPLQLPTAQPWELPSEKLQALVLFKEESHALVELVLHLYSQGFSHVRMVDNDSHRPLPTEALQEFKKRGLVTLTHDRGKTIQKRSYAYAFQRMRLMGGWSMAVDGDEFPRATKVGSLLNWLVLKDEEVCSVAIPFMLFGDSGRSHQPNSILQGFLKRLDYSRLEKESLVGGPSLQYKTAARVGCTLWPAIHHIAPFPSQRLRAYSSLNAFPRSPTIKPNKYMEEEFPDAVINHYKTQSAHFYNETKVKRSDSVFGYNHRNMSVFYEHQKHCNGKTDTSLARSALSRFPSLYDNVQSLGINDALTNPWPIENVRLALDELSRHQGLAIIGMYLCR